MSRRTSPTTRLYGRKIAKIRSSLMSLRYVLLVGEDGESTDIPGTNDLGRLMASAEEEFGTVATRPDELALLR